MQVDEKEYRKFVQNVIDNIKKNGFPDKRVSFGLDKMYEAAEKKGINFNKVLQTLHEIQIGHEKTPEKIVFFPRDRQPAVGGNANPAGGIDPSMLEGLDLSMFQNMDLSGLQNMDMKSMMGAVSGMMKNMDREQLDSIRNMYENMSDEQKKTIMDKAKDFGFGKKDD